MKYRGPVSLLCILWMLLSLCPEVFHSQGWKETADLAGIAARHCAAWHWRIVVCLVLAWHLWPGRDH